MDIDARLRRPDLDALLTSLRFRPDDAADLRRLIDDVLQHPPARHAVADLTQRLDAPTPFLQPVTFTADECESDWGRGVLPTLAFVASVDAAIQRRMTRGQTRDDALAALSDLGMQLWVDRRTHGRFGLHNEDWVATAWAGTSVWWGRLQFDVERLIVDVADQRRGDPAYFVHIPETGPLQSTDVDASLARARAELSTLFPELGEAPIYCMSWLLDPAVVQIAGPQSRIGEFAARFGQPVDAGHGDRDAIYFVFRREPPVDLESLPQNTRLERGIVEHLRAGGHVRVGLARLQEGA